MCLLFRSFQSDVRLTLKGKAWRLILAFSFYCKCKCKCRFIERDYVTPLMCYRLKCPANRYVFKSRLNCSESTAGSLRQSGSEFQTVILLNSIKVGVHLWDGMGSGTHEYKNLSAPPNATDRTLVRSSQRSCTTSYRTHCNRHRTCNHVTSKQVSKKVTTDKLQRVLNAAARVVSGTHKFDRGLSRLLHTELHWLNVPERVAFKLGLMVFNCLHNQAPQYLVDLCQSVSTVASRQHLRSANRGLLVVPRYRLSSYGRRAFSVAGPRYGTGYQTV